MFSFGSNKTNKLFQKQVASNAIKENLQYNTNMQLGVWPYYQINETLHQYSMHYSRHKDY